MEKQASFMQRFDAINDAINMAYHDLSLMLGLSDGESMILYILYGDKTVTQKEITQRTGISKQTVSSAVQKLVKKGILEKPAGLRNEPLRLTSSGHQILEEKTGCIVHIENQILADWTPEEQQQFLSLNQRYLDRLREEINLLASQQKKK
ncbi:MAG: MarR family winged helix-turn-helix transcriptional regulator [Bilifractor sp.]